MGRGKIQNCRVSVEEKCGGKNETEKKDDSLGDQYTE